MRYLNCFTCKQVFPLVDDSSTVCPSCKKANGQVMDHDRFKEGFDAGVFFNIDPRTGKPAKKKR